MMKSVFKTGLLVTFSLFLGACSTIREYTMPPERNLLSGAGSMVVGADGKAVEFELINIDALLKEYGFRTQTGTIIQMSDDYTTQAKTPKYKLLRNELQDRIIAASNQRCGAYLRELVSTRAQTHMAWGGLATFLSGAASVVTNPTSAAVLAAGSTVSNGVLNLYDQSYFSSLAVNVISSGITRQRQALLEQLRDARKNKDPAEYPLNQAIGDAINYHAACNIISGLETAANATKVASTKSVLSQPDAKETKVVEEVKRALDAQKDE